jgi:hypothetical protein
MNSSPGGRRRLASVGGANTILSLRRWTPPNPSVYPPLFVPMVTAFGPGRNTIAGCGKQRLGLSCQTYTGEVGRRGSSSAIDARHDEVTA